MNCHLLLIDTAASTAFCVDIPMCKLWALTLYIMASRRRDIPRYQPTANKPEMDLRRKETKLNVIVSGASNSWRGRHTTSYSVGDYPGLVRGSLASTSSGVPNDTPRVNARNQYRALPPIPQYRALPPIPQYRTQSQQPIPRNTEASTSHLSIPRSTVFHFDRSASAEPPESPNDNSILRRKGHIRRRHRRAVSECPIKVETTKVETVIEVPASPNDLGKSEALTPLIESVAEMYSAPSSRTNSYTYTISSPGLEEVLDSPSVYSPYDDDDDERLREELLHQPFVHRGVAALQDWANGVHDRDARADEVPEGRLLPKRVATIQLRALLRRRREEAGLPVGVPDSPADY